ncbi:hypothetical protein TWF281_010793 [Arthrobotrys megalospora]
MWFPRNLYYQKLSSHNTFQFVCPEIEDTQDIISLPLSQNTCLSSLGEVLAIMTTRCFQRAPYVCENTLPGGVATSGQAKLPLVQTSPNAKACDDEGRMYGIRPYNRAPGFTYSNDRACSTQKAADRCSVMYGCFCTAELIHPVPEDRTLPISEFQEALDRIPDTVQGHNPDYRWNYAGGTLRFTQPRRELDPYTGAPYYLEGPDVGIDQNWFTNFRNIFGRPDDGSSPSGSGGGVGSAGPAKVKREDD